MRGFILNILIVLSVIAADARQIHWITFIDTDDERVGEVDVRGREVLYSNFINEVNAALSPKGYTYSTHDYYGSRVTPENCKAIVENIKAGPEDIIVFYYIGHGGRPSTDEAYMKSHPYPQMCMAQWNEKKFIPLEWVDEKLRGKGARLAVTIGMCCNSLSNISIKNGPSFSPNYGPSYMSGKKMQNIQDLFLNHKGSILATSASPKQTSGCFKSGFGELDAYTTVLCTIFKNQLDDFNGNFDWDILLTSMQKIIDDVTDGEQTPIHDVSRLTSSTPPPAAKPQMPRAAESEKKSADRPAQQSGRASSKEEMLNELARDLNALINVSVGESERIRLERVVGNSFAGNAKIRILGQDTNDVIDREDADSFLGRLSTSRLLLNVAVVEAAFDNNNKVTSLKVRETYKK